MSLDLNIIRGELRRFETQIISALLNRGQYALNPEVYEIGKSGYQDYSPNYTLLDVMLYEDEVNKASAGKFMQPEERPFFSSTNVNNIKRKFEKMPSPIEAKYLTINLTDLVLTDYLEFLPLICKSKDSDGHFGSSAEYDMTCLSILSKRVHFGTFYVSESKFQADKEEYKRLALNDDRQGIWNFLTNSQIEDQIYQRILNKADYLQKDSRLETPRHTHIIEPVIIANYFRDKIIPLTKQGEVEYLMARGLS